MENTRLITDTEEQIIRENLEKIENSDTEPNPFEIETINGAFLGIYQSESMDNIVDLYVYLVQPSQYAQKKLPQKLDDFSSQISELSAELTSIVSHTLDIDCWLSRVDDNESKGGIYYKVSLKTTDGGSLKAIHPNEKRVNPQ